jgi:hypothetical protein
MREKRALEGWRRMDKKGNTGLVEMTGRHFKYKASADTPALAICRAIAKCLEE